MQTSLRVKVALGTAAIAGFLTACSRTPSSPRTLGVIDQASDLLALQTALPNSARVSPVHVLANEDIPSRTYISEVLSNEVVVFGPDGARLRVITIPAQPYGILVDHRHNLWVTSGWTADPSQVLEFRPGGTNPIKYLDDAGSDPMDVTMCPNGDIYVSNGGNNNPGIAVYADGSREPTGRLAYPGDIFYYYVTCDAAGNVFSTITRHVAGRVLEFPHGKQQGAHDLGIRLPAPGGIKVNNSGNLLVVDQENGSVTEYTESGTPTGVVVNDTPFSDLAVSRSGDLIGGATGALRGHGTLYTFPGGLKRHGYHGLPFPNGFAFDPGQQWAGP